MFGADGGIRTPDQLITNQLLWPTELHRLVTRKGLEPFAALGRFPVRQTLVKGAEICKPTHDHPYVSFLLSLALHHCKYNLTCAAVHESSEILTAVTVNYRSQVTAVVPQGFEPRLFWTKTRRVANYTT